MMDGGKIRDGATVMLAKLTTRPDVVRAGNLDEFMKELAEGFVTHCNDSTKLFYIGGAV